MCDFYSFSSEIEVTLSFVATIYIFLSPEPSGLSHHRRHEQEPLGGVEKSTRWRETVHQIPTLSLVWLLKQDPLLVVPVVMTQNISLIISFFVIFCFCIIVMS
jgi:hypothetical protein